MPDQELKPEWEERFYAWGNECSFDWDGAPERLESFIASAIQSSVEADRMRIAEEVQIMIDSRRKNTFSRNALETVLSIINQKK